MHEHRLKQEATSLSSSDENKNHCNHKMRNHHLEPPSTIPITSVSPGDCLTSIPTHHRELRQIVVCSLDIMSTCHCWWGLRDEQSITLKGLKGFKWLLNSICLAFIVWLSWNPDGCAYLKPQAFHFWWMEQNKINVNPAAHVSLLLPWLDRNHQCKKWPNKGL